MKWQQVGGTPEQKVPFEVMCLAAEEKDRAFEKAYLVLGGERWTLRNFYTRGALSSHLTDAVLVSILTLESFVALAKHRRLVQIRLR